MWGYSENDIKIPINATKRNDVYYAHDYSLSLNKIVCGNAVYFKAVNHNNETLSWKATHKKKCESLFYLQYHNYLVE